MVKNQQKKKTTASSPARKKRKKRFSFTWLLALLVTIALLLMFILPPGTFKKRPADPSVSPIDAPGAPEFRKDGVLKFIGKDNQPIVAIDIEIADNEDSRMQGLMYRFSLPETSGMLFIFPYEEMKSFWMKNTRLSLDIIYVDADLEIVSIHTFTQPYSTLSIPSNAPAMYVVEVIAGFTQKHGIVPGNRIEFSRSSR